MLENMKLFLLTIFVILTAKTGYGTSTCRYEIVEYTLQHMECAEHAMEIQYLISNLSKNRTTYHKIEAEIGEMCKLAESTKCYKELETPYPGPCNDAEKLQHFRNAFRVVLTFNEFMCQSNGSKFLDFVKDEGAYCYLHPDKTACYKNAKITAVASGGENYFKNDSVCSIFEADLSCHHHYENCKNPNVKTDYEQILTTLKEKFHC